jgi:hypothetical protein
MFITPHPFIKKIEQTLEVSLSVMRMVNVQLESNQNNKHVIVYINSNYPTKDYNEIIYKIEGGIYLLYKATGSHGYYDLECYFPSDKLNQIKIFLNSIHKKNDTINGTRS